MNYADQNNWDFWVRAQGWTSEEAALVLCGIIPSNKTDELSPNPWPANGVDVEIEPRHFRWIDELQAHAEISLVERRFGSKPIDPIEFVTWAADFDLRVPIDFIEAAKNVPSLSKDAARLNSFSHEPDPQSRTRNGSLKTRYAILCAGIRVIAESPYTDLKKMKMLYETSSKLNLSALASHIDQNRNRHDLASDKEGGVLYGTELRTITETLRDAASPKPKKIPS